MLSNCGSVEITPLTFVTLTHCCHIGLLRTAIRWTRRALEGELRADLLLVSLASI